MSRSRFSSDSTRFNPHSLPRCLALLAALGALGALAACDDSPSEDEVASGNVLEGDGGSLSGTESQSLPETENNGPASEEEDGGLFTAAPDISVADPETDLTEPPAPVDDGQPSAANPLVVCESAVATGEDPRIDDFEDHNDQTLIVDNRDATWYYYDDEDTMREQLVEWVPGEGAVAESKGVMHAQSEGFPRYSGIGFGLRWTETNGEHCYYDASYYDGISFWIRGTSNVRIALQNPSVRPVAEGGTCPADATCYDSHGFDVAVTEEWTQHNLSFDVMQQLGWGTKVGAFKPEELFTVEFQFTPGVAYDIWLDDLSFFKGDVTELDAGGSEVGSSDEPATTELDGGVTLPVETLSDAAAPVSTDAAAPEPGDAAAPVSMDAASDASL